jgi:hypothetical protein
LTKTRSIVFLTTGSFYVVTADGGKSVYLCSVTHLLRLHHVLGPRFQV